jgi:two-component system NtrC family response regulator
MNVPPLRARDGDIILLANHFLRSYAKEFGRTNLRFSAEGIEAMSAHPWRGNVRELENRVKRAAVMAEGNTVRAADLDLVAPEVIASLNIQEARRSAERGVIDRAVAQSNGNVSKAAALLGVSRPTLYNLIEDHGIVVHHARDLHVAHDKGRKA